MKILKKFSRVIFSSFLIILFYCANAQLSGTYSIGTSGTYINFNAAVTALSTSGVSGPVIFNVANGIYTEQVTIPNILGTSATNTITFKSALGINTDVVLTYAATSSILPWTLCFDSAVYVIFKNMTIKSTGSNYGKTICIQNLASYNEISGNIIESVILSNNNYYGIFSYNSMNNYNKISNNVITGGNCGIFLSGFNSSFQGKGNIIENNVISDYYYKGANIRTQQDIMFSGNVINSSVDNYGAEFYCCKGPHITNNKLNNCGMCLNNCDSSATQHSLVANNMITTNNKSGIYCYYTSGFDILYNTSIYYGGGSNSFPLQMYNGSRNRMYNNTFANFGLGQAVFINQNSNLDSADYNNYYKTSGSLVYWQGSKSNLTALKAAYPENNANSISQNPALISNANLHLTVSSPNNSGIPFAGITEDIDGDIRSTTTPDVGADEWEPIAHDLIIAELITPIGSICGNSLDFITVVLINLGLNAETNVPLSASVNTPTGTTVLNTIVANVPYGFHDTVVIGAVNTTALGNYYYTIYPILASDLDHSNDTLFANTLTETPLSIPHVEDFEGIGPFDWNTTYFAFKNSGHHGLNSAALSTIPQYPPWEPYSVAYFNKQIGPITANSYLTFDYRITNQYSGTIAKSIGSDTLNVLISNNCGNSYGVLHTIDTNNHILSVNWKNIILPLNSFLGSDILMGFEIFGDNSFWLDIDNVGIVKSPNVNLGINPIICMGDSFTIDAGTYGFYNVTYKWFEIGDTTIIDTSQFLTVDSAGTYYVEIKNQFGLIGSDTIVLSINPNPIVSLGTDANICGADSKVLDASSGYVYYWSDSSITQTITVDSTGYGIGTHIFWVMITDSFGCSSTDTIEITFLPNPIVNLGSDTTIKMTNGTITLDAGAGFSSYVWDDNSPYQTRQIVGSVVGAGIHTYFVDVSDANGCSGSDTIVVEVIDDTGIENKNSNTTISIFPNPTKGMFKILINGIEGDLNLQIFDASGRTLSSEKLIGVKEGYVKEFDVSTLAKGIYYIRLKNNDIIILRKLVIQ